MKKILLGIILCWLFIGCSQLTRREKNTLAGAGAGAVIGQVLGGTTGSTLIGAGLGAVGGVAYTEYKKKH